LHRSEQHAQSKLTAQSQTKLLWEKKENNENIDVAEISGNREKTHR